MIFPLVITEQNRPLFKERGREGRKERGGVGGGGGVGGRKRRPFQPPALVVLQYFPHV